MATSIYAKRLQRPGGWTPDQVVTTHCGRILSIEAGTVGDLSCDHLTLGPLDIHHHGALGFDAVRPEMDKARAWLAYLARAGVCGVLYTIGSADNDTTREAMAFARVLMESQARGELHGARVRGVHLEGPFINPSRSGAMNKAAIQPPSEDAYLRLTEGFRDIVKLVTLAPEMDGALETARAVLSHGALAQAGHTDATFDEAQRGFDAGIDGVTHTFNACRPIHQREGGVLTAAMLDDRVHAEAICDLVHVDPNLLRLLLRVKGEERVCMVSDSAPSAGLPDGRYFFGNHPVIVRDGRNYTESGGIAGSAKQLPDGIRSLIATGIPSHAAIHMATTTPLRRLKLTHALREGAEATLVGWDEAFEPLFTMVEGVRVC